MRHTLLLLLLVNLIQAQHQVNGVARSATSGKPLPFATVAADGIRYIADADGVFSLTALEPRIVVSHTGYRSDTIALQPERSFYPVLLRKYSTPKTSRADELMAQAVSRRKDNDPLKVLKSFRYEAYNKLLVSANPDSIRGDITVTKRNGLFGLRTKIDSSQFKIKRLMEKQHFFAAEKSSIIEFDGTHLKETVAGTRMSGFREPLYEVMGLSFQSYSLYGNYMELLETKYLSPLSPRGLRVYDFECLDSIDIDGRKTYLIYFKDKRRRKSAGPEGLLYLDAATFAVARSVVRVRAMLHLTATQEYAWQAEGFWFPSGRKFSIRKGISHDNVRILGETIRFDAEGESPKLASDYTELISESVYGAFQFDVPIAIRRSAVAIEVRNNAMNRSDGFWASVRPVVPDNREQATYVANDSIVARQNIEKKLRLGRKVINGYVPFGPIDVDLRQLISYNNFEGFRLGLGGVTNDRFSKIYRIDAYGAYGTKDGRWKYGVGNAIRLGQFSNTWMGAGYTDDVREIASTTFATDRRVFKLYDPRPFNITTFYRYESVRAYIETRILPKTESLWQVSRSDVTPLFNYAYFDGQRFYDRFTLSTAMVSLQWNPFSDFMQTPAGRFETDKRFPKFSIQYTQALEGIMESDFNFSKIDGRAEYEKSFLDGQKTSILVQGGYASGDIPITHLYSTSPNHLNRDAVLQRITFAGKNSFETMYFNEFFSSRYASLQLKHQFRPVKLLRSVKPVPVLVTRMVWGAMSRQERHFGIDFNTLENGFFESGVELNRIFKGFGLSGFYRYGPYQLPKFEDNLAIKVSFMLNLGL